MVPSTIPGAVVRFGVFEFDLKSGELHRHGRRVRLSGQPAQILALLLRRPGELLTREEIRQTLWPADTHVNFDQSLNAAVKRLRFALGDSPEQPVFIETMARRGYRFIAPASGPGQPALPPTGPAGRVVSSIAVLPFENATADPDADYLIDGLTEAIINALSRLPALRVLARSTVFRYRGKPVDCRALGRKLSVGAVLLGRVSLRGDQLMIGTELVEVQSGWLIWGEQFSRKLSDVLLIEAELSARISDTLRSELGGKPNGSPARRPTQNAEAYQDYLKGRYHWNKMSAEGIQTSVDCFQHALRKDPDFALAHAGLADAYCMLCFFDLLPPAEAMPKAKECAMRALEIDGDLAEAYSSLASVLKVYERDWLGAEQRYRQALQLNPNYVHAYRGYAALLAATGRFAESVVQIRRAHEVDPLSVVVSMEMAWHFFIGREYDRAIEQALRVTHFEPEYPSAQYILGIACEQKGRFEEARAALEVSLAGAPGHGAGPASLGHLFGTTGQKEEALGMLDQLDRLASRVHVAPFWHSILYAGLGDADAAIGQLERSYAQSDVWLMWLNSDPRLDSLRGDPRFQQLLRRAGFGTRAAGA